MTHLQISISKTNVLSKVMLKMVKYYLRVTCTLKDTERFYSLDGDGEVKTFLYRSRSPDSTNFWFIEAESWLSFILLQLNKRFKKGK